MQWPHPFSLQSLPADKGAYLSVANHDQADKGNVNVCPQGLIVVNFIHLQGEKRVHKVLGDTKGHEGPTMKQVLGQLPYPISL